MSTDQIILLGTAAIGVAAFLVMWLTQLRSRPPAGRILSEREIEEGAFPEFYTTPPHPERCKNLRSSGPTPCWHPHCQCMTTPRLGADEVLRRHLMTTNPKRNTRVPRKEA